MNIDLQISTLTLVDNSLRDDINYRNELYSELENAFPRADVSIQFVKELDANIYNISDEIHDDVVAIIDRVWSYGDWRYGS